ncbi:hypothetical protein BX666DRAFT_1898968 [Dichotomocladium elegans]|nr:hypothetical protein BX666DRAFT_1898968 [Dichotomocladium elegans]
MAISFFSRQIFFFSYFFSTHQKGIAMSDLADSYVILWASQSGNAEWIAKNIDSEAKKRGYSGVCYGMDAYEKVALEKTRVLIAVVSNTGDGDPPDHAMKFWRFLRRNKQADYFKGCKIAILGLGDTNYTNFNNSARWLEKRLKALGANPFYEKGLADDAEGLETVVDPWIEKLWDVLPTVLKQNEVNAVVDKVETLTIKDDNPYSADQRSNELAPGVEKYLHLANSTIMAPNPYSADQRSAELAPGVEKYLHLPNSTVETPNPYSAEKRSTELAPGVEKYLNQPKSTVNGNAKKPTLHLGYPLKLDYGGLQPGVQLTGLPRLPAASVKLVKLDTKKEKTDLPSVDLVMTPTPVIHAPVTRVKCLTTEDAMKRTLHVELVPGEEFEFEPGDAFGVIAPNDEQLVEALLSILAPTFEEGYENLYDVEGDNLPTHLQKSKSVTLADLLRYGVDITTPPRKALLRLLAEYTSDTQEKNKLMYLCSKQGAAQFNSVREQMPSLIDILATFPSCKPPMERLLDALPGHMPRYYSITNSPLKYPGKIHFAFNVIDYTTAYNVPRKGVATPWLDRLTGYVSSRASGAGAEPVTVELPPAAALTVPMFKKVNASAFTLPTDTQRPLVLIGPGTGIAPFIGFLEHRQQQRRIRKSMGGVGVNPARDLAAEFGPIWVYYGFRERAKDFLFEQELKQFKEDKTITHLGLAVSREAGEGKTYVQDLIRQDAAELHDLIINKDAAIYVCGDAKGMAKGVNDALAEMLCEYEKIEPLAANKMLVEWMGSRKYLRDLWA